MIQLIFVKSLRARTIFQDIDHAHDHPWKDAVSGIVARISTANVTIAIFKLWVHHDDVV